MKEYRLKATLNAYSLGGAAMVVSKPTYLEFPTVGKPIAVYVDTSENAIYRWDDANLKYYCVGRDYKEIEIINGGNL